MSAEAWKPTPIRPDDRPHFPGWRDKAFIPLEIIETYANEALCLFAERCGGGISFPLNAEQFVRDLFNLDVHYDDGSIMDEIDETLLGCLYPEGSVCPATDSDRVIMINDSLRFQAVTTAFTILHEGGHYILHHPIDAADQRPSAYCRTGDVQPPRWSRVPPREWQASRFAAEVLMPKERVGWLLDGKRPPEVINLEIYGPRFREYFGVSQAAMEKRLYDAGYKCAFGRYAYANVTTVR